MVDKAAVYKDLDAKMRAVEVAEKHSLSVSRVYQLKGERDVPRKPPPRKADPVEVVNAVRAGQTFSEVEADFGITKGRISQIVAERDPGAIQAGELARFERNHDVIWSITRAWNDGEPVPLIAEMHELTEAQVYEFVAMNVGGSALAARPRRAEPDAVMAAVAAGASTPALRKCFGVSRQRLHQIKTKMVHGERRVS